ncbi:MAG TPA: protein kinase [Gemmatimonadaceae bacterium]
MTELRDQLQASLGEAYAIERELGGGGMSRVFVAEERSLGRLVVVKVLPAELSGSVSIARFRREISLAARLQHPHIVPVLSAGEIGGQPYYTMPFVDGESLRTRLSRGELSIPETISILRDVAKALEYAQSKGVAHRDIKPDNVLIAGTSAVIADFGVAKAISDATAGGTLTSVGVALGTPAYMAPEQAAGDPTTDVRADYYAFGAMAYEMLAGHPPFAGRSTQATLAAHAVETPPAIATVRPATPAPLAELVMRCLEKRPGDRPQSATEILHALDAIPSGSTFTVSAARAPAGRASGTRSVLIASVVVGVIVCVVAVVAWRRGRDSSTTGTAIRSIAVIPFENTSGDTTFDYLEDGITDHVRDALNGIPDLMVKARGSSRQLKGRDAKEIGAKLGVGVVLQGTVSRSSSRLHVAAELVRASDDNALWSGTFDGQPNELGGMQDTIVRAITGKLHLAHAEAQLDRTQTMARGTKNIDAYDLYLQGRHAADGLRWDKASKLYQQAIALDPRFARAYGALSISYGNETTLGVVSVDSMNRLARAAASQALALDSTVVEAFVGQGNAFLNDMRFADAVHAFDKGYMMDSSNVDVAWAYGAALLQTGEVQAALAKLRRARELDPLSSTVIGILGYTLMMLHRPDEAVAALRLAIDLEPKNVLVHQGLGFVFAFDHMPDSAVREFETAFALDSTLFGRRSNLVFGYAAAGRWSDAARQRDLLERDVTGNSPHWDHMVADLTFGEYDAAMTALERGIADHEPLFGVPSIPCDPLFDPLKSDRRFEALMQRLSARACPAFGNWPIGAPPR